MSKHGKQRKGDKRHCCRWLRHGPIKRVVRGLAERFGVSRGAVITGFVLGFLFMPLLTLFMFLGAWLWVVYPEQAERGLKRLNASVMAAMATARKKFFEEREAPVRRAEQKPSATYTAQNEVVEPMDFPELCRAFDALEQRTAGMEAVVTSDEYQLRREFRQLRDVP